MPLKHAGWINWVRLYWRKLPQVQYGPVHGEINRVLGDLRSGTRRSSRRADRHVLREIRTELAKQLPSGAPR